MELSCALKVKKVYIANGIVIMGALNHYLELILVN